MTEDVYVSGITPETLKQATEIFHQSGSNYLCLTQFSIPPVCDSFYDKGLVFQAFTGAVRKVLQHYRAVVLSIPADISIFKMTTACRQILQQLQ